MGKSVRTIVTVAAMVAVPMAAPALAGTLGVSGALAGMGMSAGWAGAIGSGLVGAGLGGTVSKLAGGSFRQGAIAGGLSSGISGYFQGSQAANAGSAGGAGGGAGSGSGAGAAGSGGAAQGATMQSTFLSDAPQMSFDPSLASSSPQSMIMNQSYNPAQVAGYNSNAYNSAVLGAAAGASGASVSNLSNAGVSEVPAAGLDTGGLSPLPQTSVGSPGGVARGVADGAGGYSATPASSAGWYENLTQRLTDPNVMVPEVGKLATAALTKPDTGDLERVQAQEEAANAANMEITRKRVSAADQLRAIGDNTNPGDFGMQAFGSTKRQADSAWRAREQELRARGVSETTIAALRAKEQNRSALTASSAYWQGYGTGREKQQSAYSAAAGAYGSASAPYSSAARTMYDVDSGTGRAAGQFLENITGWGTDASRRAAARRPGLDYYS